MKRIARLLAGIVFIVLGIIGLFLPVLQGILFILAGLLLLAPYSYHVRRLLSALKRKYPRVYEKSRGLKARFTARKKK